MICMREKKEFARKFANECLIEIQQQKIINLVQEEMGCYGIKWSLKSSSVYLLTLWGVMVVLIPITDIIFCRPQSSGLSLKIGSGGPAGLLKADYSYTLCCLNRLKIARVSRLFFKPWLSKYPFCLKFVIWKQFQKAGLLSLTQATLRVCAG